MHKKWIIPSSIFFILIISATIYFTTALNIESAWASSNEQLIVLPNKAWKITFSEKLNRSYINDTYIYVTNEDGVKSSVSLSYNDKQKTLTVFPPKNGYKNKNKYTLHIDRSVESVHGRELRKHKRFTFFVKETLPTLASKDELNQHFLKLMDKQKRAFDLNGGDKAVMESAKDSGPVMKADSLSSDYSNTNNQVQGVDESDIIKTNGTFVFQVFDREVRIVKAIPSDKMELVKTLTFDSGFTPNELFLYEDQLVVIGFQNSGMFSTKVSIDSLMPIAQSTVAIVYDVKDPSQPQMIREVEVEGHLVQARKIGGIVYLVSNYYPDFWMLEKDNETDLRPRYKDSNTNLEFKAVEYDKIQYLPESKETNFTIITTFDLEKSNQKVSVTTYLGSGNQLYMSEKNLYVAVTNYPMANIFRDSTVTPNTSIYKFSVNQTNVKFHSSAEVAGTVLNQFSMDEHNGYFRLATTEGFSWDEKQPSANHLLILDKNLVEVGKVTDLARGERIYSARFIGDRIFIVTFKETDPLFVIDAKDPKQPKVLGELKIPGFSNYLHPYDENHLIGFGHDTKILANKGGSNPVIITNGVKLSLFDVSDLTNPKEKFSEIIGGRGTYSSLNHDHKAFLFQKQKGLLAFPISVYENVEGNVNEQKFEFQGGYAYQVDLTNGFKLLQKVSHMSEDAIYEEWENSIQRFIYIGENIYAISPNKITAHSKKDLVQIGEVKLK